MTADDFPPCVFFGPSSFGSVAYWGINQKLIQTDPEDPVVC